MFQVPDAHLLHVIPTLPTGSTDEPNTIKQANVQRTGDSSVGYEEGSFVHTIHASNPKLQGRATTLTSHKHCGSPRGTQTAPFLVAATKIRSTNLNGQGVFIFSTTDTVFKEWLFQQGCDSFASTEKVDIKTSEEKVSIQDSQIGSLC